MKIRYLCSVLVALIMLSVFRSFTWAGEFVGTQEFDIFSPAREKTIAITIWYPSDGGGGSIQVGANRIFEGTSALENALPINGKHPLIVMSHGSGSNIQSMAWLATSLAKAGFIVAGPNHPRTTTGDSTPEDTPKLWQRTNDLSILISFLTSATEWHNTIDSERIGVLGFSLGGAAAMEIAGARANLNDYVNYCDTYPSMADCRWFVSGQAYMDGQFVPVDAFDLRQVDKKLFEQSNRDPRIKSAVLVDPSVAQAFNEQSLAAIQIPMTFINLGHPENIPVAVDSKMLAQQTPHGTIAYVNNAVHYSFLPECKAGATAFLKKIGETDLLCDDAGSRTRADIHAELVELIERAFTKTFK